MKITKVIAALLSIIMVSTLLLPGCAVINPGPNKTEVPGETTPPPFTDENLQEAFNLIQGVVISKVYGNGGDVDGVCKEGFIELYNTTDHDIDLSKAALYYKGGKTPIYKEFDFGGQTIKAGGKFLVRTASCETKGKTYDNTNEIIKLVFCDLDWDITIDNKEYSIIFTVKGANPDSAKQAAEESKAVSYVVATDNYYFDTAYVNDIGKNKMVVRTELTTDSGFHVENLAKANSAKLRQLVPETSYAPNVIEKSLLSEVTFSKDAGFYDTAIKVELSAPDGYNTIYYTLDGSDPTIRSSSRKKYEGPIELADSFQKGTGLTTQTAVNVMGDRVAPATGVLPGGYTLRAVAVNGKEMTPVYTNTYFVSSAFKNYGVSVMALSIPMDELFGTPGFYVNYSPSSNDPNPRGTGIMEVFSPNGDRRGYSKVELSVSGHGSSGWAMKSMKIYYRGVNNTEGGLESNLYYDLFGGASVNSKGQTITQFDRILLRNSGNDCATTYIRDAYMQRVSTKLEISTMASRSVLFFINGECWGVYNVRERYSADYFEQHYGVDGDNVALLESDYSQVHTNQNADFIVSNGIEGDEKPFNDLVKYMKSHDLSKETYYNHVLEQMDIVSFINMFISRLYYNAIDWPENNIKVWRNRNPEDPSGIDQKWKFTLLDLDFGISFYHSDVNTTETADHFGRCYATNCVIGNMMTALLKNESFKKEFMIRFYEALNEVFVEDEMIRILNEFVDERSPIFQIQVDRWPGDGANWNAYNDGIARMERFSKLRTKICMRQMCSFFGVTESELQAMTGNYITATVLGSRLEATVDNQTIDSSWMMKFDKSATINIAANAKEGFEVTAIIFTDTTGKVQRFEGTSATITTSIGGEITFETKRLKTDTPVSGVQSGITAGSSFMFYLTPEGSLYAWGNNVNNVLGIPQGGLVTKPTLVMDNVAKVETCHSNDAENSNHNVMTAVITTDGDLYTVGFNNMGDLARDGDAGEFGLVQFDGEIADVSVGLDHLLVLDKSGNLWGIGGNTYGQLGETNFGGSVTKFIKLASNVKLISAGRRNTAYVDNKGDCYVLGDARWNKFNDSVEPITKPYKLLSKVAYITSGEHEMLLVTESGALYYAGWRSIMGFNQGEGSHGAVLLMKSGVKKAAIHFSDVIILKEDGGVAVYGTNNGGSIMQPVTNGTPSAWVSSGVEDVAIGFAFSAMLMEDGTIKITGDNSFGQAGNGRASGTVSEYVLEIG